LEAEFGFDKPPLERFLNMMWNYMRFDFGESYFRSVSVIDLVLEKMPVSISLGLWSTLIIYLISIPLGIKASRSETYANLGIALGLALTYFLLTILISWTEKHPMMRPDLLIWLPNFLFQAIGLYLLHRTNRH